VFWLRSKDDFSWSAHMLARFLSFIVASVLLSLFSAASTAATVSYAPFLAPGWNLVGNSTSAALDVKALLGTQATSITSVWKWNAATSRWAFYSPALDTTTGALANYVQTKGYDVLTSINPGDGFWVNVNVSATSGVVLSLQSGTGFALGASTLKPNWNLVATGDDSSPALFSTTVGDVTTLWAWNSANSSWYFYAPSAASNGTLASYISSKNYQDFGSTTLGNGRGFWVNYAGATTGGSTGTTSGSVTAPLAALATGESYRLVYSAGMGIGIDQRKASASFLSSGALSGYVVRKFDGTLSTTEAPTLGSAAVAQLAGDDKVTVGRWNGGTTGGSFYALSGFAIAANQGFHYAMGVTPAALPADGTAKCYTLTAATQPTISDGSVAPGSVVAGAQAKIIFGAAGKMALDMSFAVGNRTVVMQTVGGMASPASFVAVGNGVSFYGTAIAPFTYLMTDTTAGTTTRALMFVAGANAERLGMSFVSSTGGSITSSLQGAAYLSESTCN
jgi:hypothetical protein